MLVSRIAPDVSCAPHRAERVAGWLLRGTVCAWLAIASIGWDVSLFCQNELASAGQLQAIELRAVPDDQHPLAGQEFRAGYAAPRRLGRAVGNGDRFRFRSWRHFVGHADPFPQACRTALLNDQA